LVENIIDKWGVYSTAHDLVQITAIDSHVSSKGKRFVINDEYVLSLFPMHEKSSIVKKIEIVQYLSKNGVGVIVPIQSIKGNWYEEHDKQIAILELLAKQFNTSEINNESLISSLINTLCIMKTITPR